ncbi:MAG: hypothetical protein KF767_03610 [Bdellovibrionaceae bacterium]|nr:hypothetical protein [Pseudobdellovibrionaceae bacterium]
MSFRSQMLSVFAFLWVGLLILSYLAFSSINDVTLSFSSLSDESVPKLGDLSGLRNRGRQTHGESLTLVLFGDSAEVRARSLPSLTKALGRYDEIAAEYAGRGLNSAEEKELFQTAQKAWQEVQDLGRKIEAQAKLSEISTLDTPENRALLIKMDSAVTAHQKNLLALDDYTVAAGEQWTNSATAASSRAKHLVLILAGIIIGFSMAISYWVANRISKALTQIASSLHQGANEVAKQSDSVRVSSVTLNTATARQASAVNQTVAATSEVVAMIERTTESSERNLGIAQECQQHSARGRASVQQMVSAIEQIHAMNHDMFTRIRERNQEFSEISRIMVEIQSKTAMINDIVFKTNLLSFNASVEAARAGEYGKGFAVVAQEVAKLAATSGEAAKEIESLLQLSSDRVSEIVTQTAQMIEEMIETGNEKLDVGQKTATSCAEAFADLNARIDTISLTTEEVTRATKEQLVGIAEINRAMQDVSDATELTAQNAEECSSAAQITADQVTQTEISVSQLLRLVNGRSHEPAA